MANSGRSIGVNTPETIVIFHKDHLLSPFGVNAGAETATLLLARELVRQGHQIFVAGQLSPDVVSGDLAKDGVTYLDLGEAFNVTQCFDELRDVYGLKSYHLLVASRAQALLESRGRPEVLSRLFITHEPSPLGLGLQAKIIGRVADRVICVSEAQREKLIEAGCEAVATRVVPNGADLAMFRAGEPTVRDYNRLVFVGALVVDKGIRQVLEAFSHLKSQHPQFSLDIYGSSEMWGRGLCFDMEQARQIPGVTFHGAVSQEVVAEAFRTAGLLVLPSIYFDSFPLTVVEAQVSGLPVLGSLRGGMREIIIDGKTGRLLDDLETAPLANAMAQMTLTPGLLPAMSRAALELIRPKFSWEQTAAELLGEMRAIAASKSSPGLAAPARPEIMTAVSASAPKVGVFTTWNQACGLATYAEHFVNKLGEVELTILAEEVAARDLVKNDDARVMRVWRRNAAEYTELQAALESEEIEVLHLNCHYRFFEAEPLRRLLAWCRERSIKTIAHIHNPFTLDPALQVLAGQSDLTLVHTPENRIEMLANGAEYERVQVLEHGVEIVNRPAPEDARRALSIAEDVPLVVCFGFVQAHKGIDEIVAALPSLLGKYPKLQLAVVGGPHVEDANSLQYAAALKQYARDHGLGERVTFCDQFVSEELLSRYLRAADVVVLNYRSNYYEASGALARALGAGAAVVTSTAPAFARLTDTVFHLTAGYPVALALDAVLGNPLLKATLQDRARVWAQRYSWENSAAQLEDYYRRLAGEARTERAHRVQAQSRDAAPTLAPALRGKRSLRVLMQNREQAFTHRGGDTVVMERIAEELGRIGVEVQIDVEGRCEPRDFDLVHLFNFAMPQISEGYARKCVEQGVPYVVTCMYEDRPKFFNQMIMHFRALEAYIGEKQNPAVWEPYLNAIKGVEPSERWENTYTATHAAVLIATGEAEREVLKLDYPDAKRIETYRLGCDVTPNPVGPELFIRETGLKDFVLCVGRLETRKNQLMLMKALENSDVTLVFVTGGFTYQPEYEAACRAFKRRGKTLFLGRLSPELLDSAFAAAKVHALPSWYELPGIVSMEAARLGKNLVVTEYGTTRDYFGEHAFYCEPGDPQSIERAVSAALAAPQRFELAKAVSDCTWENAAKRTLEIYKGALGDMEKEKQTNYELPEWQDPRTIDHVVRAIEAASKQASTATESVAMIPNALSSSLDKVSRDNLALELCAAGDDLLKKGLHEQALEKFMEAGRTVSTLARPVRSAGVAYLMMQKLDLADEYFRKALRVDAADSRSLAGLGAVEWARGNQTKAFDLYLHAVQLNPGDQGTLLHFMNACYVLNRLGDLADVLLEVVARDPLNADLQYSLAGCYYKQGKLLLAGHAVERALAANGAHGPSLELKQMIDQQSAASLSRPAAMPVSATQATVSQPVTPLAHQLQGPEKTAQPEGSIVERFRPKFSNSVAEQLRTLEEAKTTHEYQRMIEGAEALLTSEDASDEQLAHARMLRAEALACTNRLEEADVALAALENVRPFAHRVLTDRGAIAAARQNWAQAENFFNRSLEAFADFDGALAGLGMCAMQKNDRELAWSFFRKSLAVNPENMRALLGVVQLGYPLNRLSEVEQSILAYLEIHPANLSVLYSHAGCCYAQGRLDEARSQLEKIRIFDPQHKLANELLDKIESDRNGQQR